MNGKRLLVEERIPAVFIDIASLAKILIFPSKWRQAISIGEVRSIESPAFNLTIENAMPVLSLGSLSVVILVIPKGNPSLNFVIWRIKTPCCYLL